MDRLFLDANVLFSAAYRGDAGVARLWTLSECSLLSSAYAVEEARRNLAEQVQLDRLEELLAGVQVVGEVVTNFPLPEGIELPQKDIPILAGAVHSRASHLITGDYRDFGPYFGETISGVLILPPGDYLRIRG